MRKANLFLLLPETNPTTNWSKSNEPFQSEESIQSFINNKVSEIDSVEIENYQGFYDNLNLKNFFEHFDVFDDYYPPTPKRMLLNKIKDWDNWQAESEQKENKTYKLFNQKIENHTLPEIAERQNNTPNENFALLNNQALTIQSNKITVKIFGTANIDIDNIKDKEELKIWFSKNRLPQRVFHIIEKHGENGQGNWNNASPLMCSEEEAQILLNTAIGKDVYKLYNFDRQQNMFIVFWNENEPHNQYHGYHLEINTTEISSKIKKIFLR